MLHLGGIWLGLNGMNVLEEMYPSVRRFECRCRSIGVWKFKLEVSGWSCYVWYGSEVGSALQFRVPCAFERAYTPVVV